MNQLENYKKKTMRLKSLNVWNNQSFLIQTTKTIIVLEFLHFCTEKM